MFSWPVRTLGFSFDGQYIASASEDHFVDVVSFEFSSLKKTFNLQWLYL